MGLSLSEITQSAHLDSTPRSCRRLIVELPDVSGKRLRECLLALPSLHTLYLSRRTTYGSEAFRSAFKHLPNFPSIKTAAIPISAHPIMSRFPGVEDFVCFGDPTRCFNPLLTSMRKPRRKERQGRVEPVLKSFAIVCQYRVPGLAEGMFPLSSALLEAYPRMLRRSR